MHSQVRSLFVAGYIVLLTAYMVSLDQLIPRCFAISKPTEAWMTPSFREEERRRTAREAAVCHFRKRMLYCSTACISHVVPVSIFLYILATLLQPVDRSPTFTLAYSTPAAYYTFRRIHMLCFPVVFVYQFLFRTLMTFGGPRACTGMGCFLRTWTA